MEFANLPLFAGDRMHLGGACFVVRQLPDGRISTVGLSFDG